LDDDDAMNILAGGEEAGKTGLEKLNSDTFWFKPVASNMAHHTVLGEALCEFDFLAQGYIVKTAVFNEGRPVSITVAEHGSTMTCNISHIPFDLLSKSLTVWSEFEIGYTIIPSLCHCMSHDSCFFPLLCFV